MSVRINWGSNKELATTLRAWADTLEASAEVRDGDWSITQDYERVQRASYARPEIRLRGRAYEMRFYLFGPFPVQQAAPRSAPAPRCRCGLTKGHEPTCPELP